MQFQQEDEDEEEGDEENGEEKKKDNPGDEIRCKVVVTRESGLQASEPTRWGHQTITLLPLIACLSLCSMERKVTLRP